LPKSQAVDAKATAIVRETKTDINQRIQAGLNLLSDTTIPAPIKNVLVGRNTIARFSELRTADAPSILSHAQVLLRDCL